MTVMMVVDVFEKQQFGTTCASKLEVAVEVSAIRGNDRVGFIPSPTASRRASHPRT